MRLTALTVGLILASVGSLPARAQPPEPQTAPEQGSTNLEGLTVTAPRADLPLTRAEQTVLQEADMGFPRLSLEQAARILCEAERIPAEFGSLEARAIARRVYRQTLEFEQVKQAYREGRATEEDLIQADRARQYALRWQFPSAYFLPEAELNWTRAGAVTVETVDWRIAPRSAQTLIVKVRFTNDGRRAARVGEMTLLALDIGGRSLGSLGMTARPTLRLQPGQSIVVEMPYEDFPSYLHTVVAHFGRGPAPDPRPCNHEDRLREPGGLLAASEAALPVAGEGTTEGEIPRVEVLMGQARWVEEEGRRVLQISGSAVNRAPLAMRMPEMTVLLIDEAGQAVGGVRLRPSDAVIASGEAQDFTLNVVAVDALPAANGADPMALMQRVSLLVQ